MLPIRVIIASIYPWRLCHSAIIPCMENTPIGIFWECRACGFRFVEAPVGERVATRQCPICGGEATIGAAVYPQPTSATAHHSPTPRTTIALLLDNIRSAYNVGSAFRTADGAGIAHLYLAGITPAPPHRGIAKTALGAERAVPWSKHPNAPRLAARLRAEGWTLWALETAPNAMPLHSLLKTKLPNRLLLVVGNEVAGIDPAVLSQADAVVSLPMLGVKRSLNVASALAAAVYMIMQAQSTNDKDCTKFM